MIVRILEYRAGAAFCDWPGDLVDLPDAEARSLIVAGQAEPVPDVPEGAVTAAPERAMKPKPISRRR